MLSKPLSHYAHYDSTTLQQPWRSLRSLSALVRIMRLRRHFKFLNGNCSIVRRLTGENENRKRGYFTNVHACWVSVSQATTREFGDP